MNTHICKQNRTCYVFKYFRCSRYFDGNVIYWIEYLAKTEETFWLCLCLAPSLESALVCKVLGDVIKIFCRTDRILFCPLFFFSGLVTKFLYCKLIHSPNKAQSSSEVNRNCITNVKQQTKASSFFPWTKLISKN